MIRALGIKLRNMKLTVRKKKKNLEGKIALRKKK